MALTRIDDYEDALARPTSASGRGWAHADDDSMLAAACRAQHEGGHFGLNPGAIYIGARKRGLASKDIVKADAELLMDLMWEGIECLEGDCD